MKYTIFQKLILATLFIYPIVGVLARNNKTFIYPFFHWSLYTTVNSIYIEYELRGPGGKISGDREFFLDLQELGIAVERNEAKKIPEIINKIRRVTGVNNFELFKLDKNLFDDSVVNETNLGTIEIQ